MTTTPDTTTAPEAPFSPLIADIITAQLSMTHAVTEPLIDSLMNQVADANAREDAVRAGVEALLGGRYMPTPDAIRNALYPSTEFVARFRKEPQS